MNKNQFRTSGRKSLRGKALLHDVNIQVQAGTTAIYDFLAKIGADEALIEAYKNDLSILNGTKGKFASEKFKETLLSLTGTETDKRRNLSTNLVHLTAKLYVKSLEAAANS